MTTNKQKIKCLFGYHDYTVPYKGLERTFICRYCKRFGYYKSTFDYEVWYEFDEKENIIHRRYSDGHEIWFGRGEKGNTIYRRDSDGHEVWWDEEGHVIKTEKA